MSAPIHDLHIAQGEDFFVELTLDIDEVPMDLTGYSFVGQIRLTASSASALAEFSFDPLELETGRFGVRMASEKTLALPAKNCVYDLFMTSPEGMDTQILRGTVHMVAGVTRMTK